MNARPHDSRRGFARHLPAEDAVATSRGQRIEVGTRGAGGVAGATWVLTASGPRQMRALVGRQHVTILHGQPFTSTPEGVWSLNTGEVVLLRTVEGYAVRLAPHQSVQLRDGSWQIAERVQPGDSLRLQRHALALDWPGQRNGAESGSKVEYVTLLQQLSTSASVQTCHRPGVLLPAGGYEPAVLQRMLLRLGLATAISSDARQLRIVPACLPQLCRLLGDDHALTIQIRAAGPGEDTDADPFFATALATAADGRAELYTCSIPGVRSFDANGFVVANA